MKNGDALAWVVQLELAVSILEEVISKVDLDKYEENELVKRLALVDDTIFNIIEELES